MLKVIASMGCVKCKEASRKLRKHDINFSYKLISELEENEAENYKSKAINAGQQNFPIIIQEGEIVNLEDVIKYGK